MIAPDSFFIAMATAYHDQSDIRCPTPPYKNRAIRKVSGESALPNYSAQCATIKLAMQRNRKRDLASPHNDMAAPLPDPVESLRYEQITQLRARKDAQLSHASRQAL